LSNPEPVLVERSLAVRWCFGSSVLGGVRPACWAAAIRSLLALEWSVTIRWPNCFTSALELFF
jgi:hypothetical protein